MKIHYLQHVPFEGIGSMEGYFHSKGHEVQSIKLYQNDEFPLIDDIDWLIVMGGPMGVYDYEEYPWLEREIEFIKSVIISKKLVLGICLGAQLIASCLGAKIKKNKFKEIGWFPIGKPDKDNSTILSNIFSEKLTAFHWHGDTFDLPEGATLLASSDICQNQAFSIFDRIFGFQFHLETTSESANLLIENCSDDLDSSEYVQSAKEILCDENRFICINKIMDAVLSQIEMSFIK